MSKITLELAIHEVNAILTGLAKLPYEAVHELITLIRGEGTKQIEANPAIAAAPAATPETPAVETPAA